MGLNGYIPGTQSSEIPQFVFRASLASPIPALPLKPSEQIGQWVDAEPEEFDGSCNLPGTGNVICRKADGSQHTTRYQTEAGYQSLLSMALFLKNQTSIDDLFSALPSKLLEIVDFDFIGITLFDEQSQRVEWRFSELEGCIRSNIISEVKGETIAEWVYQHQEPLIIPLPAHELVFQKELEGLAGAGMRSVCALPLTFLHKRYGSMHIASKRDGAYTEPEVRFLSSVADLVASAIENALKFEALSRAKEDLRSEKERLNLLLEVSNRLVADPERKELLRAVCASVRRMMNCDAVAIHLPNLSTNTLQIVATDSPGESEAMEENSLVAIEGCLSQTLCEVFRSGIPVLVDRTREPGCRQNCGSDSFRSNSGNTDRSICALPLTSHGHVLGVMELIRLRDQPFAQSDVDVMGQITRQIAIAMENALAYEQMTELKNQLAREKLYLEDEIRSEHGFEEIIGRSAAIRAVLRKIETVAPTDSTVLICGETGTGKELIARAIHERSQRHTNSFVKLNCAAIPTGLLESELFGHERGAFTGAIVQRIGRFELANHGTAFLDEIGEIALELQPKLLRVLQEREFERLGSTRTIKTDARLIAATNRNLAQCVADKTFRADLFYRLNVFPIEVPTLRERPEDIPLLVRHFVHHYARRMGRNIDTIPSETMEVLVKYAWPGNIRELQNLIEHSVILTSGTVLKVPLANLQSGVGVKTCGEGSRTLEEVERDFILSVLKGTKWVQSGPNGAAARLGMHRSTLQFRMKKLGIVRPG